MNLQIKKIDSGLYKVVMPYVDGNGVTVENILVDKAEITLAMSIINWLNGGEICEAVSEWIDNANGYSTGNEQSAISPMEQARINGIEARNKALEQKIADLEKAAEVKENDKETPAMRDTPDTDQKQNSDDGKSTSNDRSSENIQSTESRESSTDNSIPDAKPGKSPESEDED